MMYNIFDTDCTSFVLIVSLRILPVLAGCFGLILLVIVFLFAGHAAENGVLEVSCL